MTTTGAVLKIQMLKLYLVEQKKCTMWYIILGTTICSCMVIHKSVSHSKTTDHLMFRLLLIKGVIGEQGLCPILCIIVHLLTHFLKHSEHYFMEIIHTMLDRQSHKDELFVLNKL